MSAPNATSADAMEAGTGGGGTNPIIMAQVAMFVLTFVAGVTGNTLVIYVVARYSRMQTVTNMYIVNLAVADECFLLSVPVLVCTMLRGQFIFGRAACKLYYLCTAVNQFTSSTLLLIISVDRYIAVCHSTAAPRWRTPLISKLLSAGAWCYSVLLMIPIIQYADIEVYPDQSSHCVIIWNQSQKPNSGNSSDLLASTLTNVSNAFATFTTAHNLTDIPTLTNISGLLGNSTMEEETAPSDMVIYTTYLCITAFIIPFTLIIVFYCLIIRKLLRVSRVKKSKEKERSNRKVTRLVMTVIAVYLTCNAPYWVNQMYIASRRSEKPSKAFVIFSLFFYCLNYANPAFNPLIYAFLSDNFRRSFARAFTCLAGSEVDATLQEDRSVFPARRRPPGVGAPAPAGIRRPSSSACLEESDAATDALDASNNGTAELLDKRSALKDAVDVANGTGAESTSL